MLTPNSLPATPTAVAGYGSCVGNRPGWPWGVRLIDQGSLNIVAPVPRNRVTALEALLESMGTDPGRNPVLPFERFPTIHFARLVLFPETTDHRGNAIPSTLVLATNFDGGIREHLDELVRTGGSGLDRIFGHCDGYPGPDGGSETARLRFLEAHRVRTHALFVNTRGRTVQQVARERSLNEAIQHFLSSRELSGRSDRAAVDAIKDFVGQSSELKWALEPPESAFAFRLVRTARLVGFALVAIALIATLFVLPLLDFVYRPLMQGFPFWSVLSPLPWIGLLLFLLILRLHELGNAPDNFRPPNARLRDNESVEDLGTHNQLSAIGFLQPGVFRRVAIRIVLWLINFSTENLFYRGHLAGVNTIHFARWVMLDRGRVYFFSNYDGSLESYNDDFVDLVPYGLNLVFSHAQGWPRTRFLIFGGARDEQAFKFHLRDHQTRTHLWYEAPPYEGLTAVNIDRNTRVREGLGRELSDAEAREWLKLL